MHICKTGNWEKMETFEGEKSSTERRPAGKGKETSAYTCTVWSAAYPAPRALQPLSHVCVHGEPCSTFWASMSGGQLEITMVEVTEGFVAQPTVHKDSCGPTEVARQSWGILRWQKSAQCAEKRMRFGVASGEGIKHAVGFHHSPIYQIFQ